MPLGFFLGLVRLLRSVPFLHRLSWSVRKNCNAVKRQFLVRRPVIDAGPVLQNIVEQRLPYAAGKMGSIEVQALRTSIKRSEALAAGHTPSDYKPYLGQILHLNAGVFPQDDATYDRFGKVFLSAVRQCDMLMAWDVAGEADILSRYSQAVLVKFRTLEPFFSLQPWTAALQGRRVLVISPFVDSIRRQYARRENLWDNPAMLPAFDLLTLRAPLSAGLAKPQDPDWFAALERLQQGMSALNYDVALIGAGAFSLPLAVHAKRMDKIGIHLGGSLQFLFGVSGTRWRKDKAYRHFIKRGWIAPGADETPREKSKIEDGCYW